MLYICLSFIFGLLIPFLARRFSKIMPATPAYIIYRMLKPLKRTPYKRWKNNERYAHLISRFAMRSFGWGVISAALGGAAYFCFAVQNVAWLLFLIWILLLLYEIDERTLLLPDVLTVPLLIGGFCFAAFADHGNLSQTLIPVQISALGAVLGYVLPVVASLFLVVKYPEAFGGGDIKLLAAIGAWLGFGAVPVVIVASSIVFALICLIKRQRAGAFGPSIVIATLGVVFFVNLVMIN